MVHENQIETEVYLWEMSLQRTERLVDGERWVVEEKRKNQIGRDKRQGKIWNWKRERERWKITLFNWVVGGVFYFREIFEIKHLEPNIGKFLFYFNYILLWDGTRDGRILWRRALSLNSVSNARKLTFVSNIHFPSQIPSLLETE